jgi:hypothetical protein
VGPEHIDPDAAAVDTREQQEDGRKEELRNAILAVLPPDDPDGMTRDEIWERLPDGVRKNQVRFKRVLDAECGKLWRKEGSCGKKDPFRYWRLEPVTHPGQERAGNKD